MKKKAMALGFFDGVHDGHAEILRKTAEQAKKDGLIPGVLTFEHRPKSFFTGEAFDEITPMPFKEKIIKSFGIEEIDVLDFDTSVFSMSPDDFINDILIKKLRCAHVFCGENYRFGAKAAGTPELLSKNIKTTVCDSVTFEGETVSSTRIRMLIKNGETEKAFAMMKRPFFISGEVVHGRGIGKTIGFPTVNILYDRAFLLPMTGVYVSEAYVNGEKYRAITNVGTRPTFSDGNGVFIETHILDFERDIYGEKITVTFLKRLRGEIGFKSAEELRLRIAEDVLQIKKYDFEGVRYGGIF